MCTHVHFDTSMKTEHKEKAAGPSLFSLFPSFPSSAGPFPLVTVSAQAR